MCGVLSLWNREGTFTEEDVDTLFSQAENRGQDGTGAVIISPKDSRVRKFKSVSPYVECRRDLLDWVNESFVIGDVLLGICRAMPATESKTTEMDMQPLNYEGCFLVHNGCVADVVKHEANQTSTDSETILRTYVEFGRDMKKTMEYLIGGYAFIMYDSLKNSLLIVNDYKPLSIGYMRGKGFMAHSEEVALKKTIQNILGVDRCGMVVWENYYYHPQNTYTIREIDLDSGVEQEYGFMPRFITPFYDSSVPHPDKEKVFVIASGGIDSGLTAHVMSLAGYDVELIHFNYGQKSSEAEALSVQKLSEHLGLQYRIINLRWLYEDSPSSLVNENTHIDSGTEKFIKSTTCWCENRNQLFLSIVTTLAERAILSGEYGHVHICGGYANLEEEGIYPDNSENFVCSFFDNVKYSTITGHRISFVNVFQNIMKYEEWLLGSAVGFPFEYTCSCDDAIVRDGKVLLCRQCGSTLLSMWAAEQAGVTDPRAFYDKDVDAVMREKKFSGKLRDFFVQDIVNRMLISDEAKEKVLCLIKM